MIWNQSTDMVSNYITNCWAEIIGTEIINADSNFFELGGDSLQMMVMLFRVQETFGIEITPDVLFENPTIGAFAAHVAQAVANKAESHEGVL